MAETKESLEISHIISEICNEFRKKELTYTIDICVLTVIDLSGYIRYPIRIVISDFAIRLYINICHGCTEVKYSWFDTSSNIGNTKSTRRAMYNKILCNLRKIYNYRKDYSRDHTTVIKVYPLTSNIMPVIYNTLLYKKICNYIGKITHNILYLFIKTNDIITKIDLSICMRDLLTWSTLVT